MQALILMKIYRMYKTNLLIISFFIAVLNITAQESTTNSENPNTIDQQFSEMLSSSNNYQDYKVIKKYKLNQLQKNTRDSIDGLRSEIDVLQNQIDTQNSKIGALNTSLDETKGTLDSTRAEKDSINFLGIQMSKAGYKSLMWGLIAALALALFFFIYKFQGSNSHTREARLKLEEVEAEYEDYRKKALEKEQRMGRLLQDERNKVVKQGKK